MALRSSRIVCTVGALFLTWVLPSTPVLGGPVASWSLDGHLEDSVGDHDGVFSGGRVPNYVADRLGNAESAVQLDGSDDWIGILQGRTGGVPIYPELVFSVAFWVKARAQSGRVVFGEGSTDSRDPVFEISTSLSGKVAVLIRDDEGNVVLEEESTSTAFDDTWHHVVWAQDDGNAKLYIDGVEDATDFSYELGDVHLNSTALGGLVTFNRPCCYLQGSLDDVGLWDHELSLAEVEALCPPPDPCDPATLSSISPDLVSTTGGALVTLMGSGFTDAHTVEVGGRALLNLVRVSSTLLRGELPDLAVGRHDVVVRCPTGGVVATLPRGLEAGLPPEITLVEPTEISESGGVAVVITGRGFRAGVTSIRFGLAPLANQRVSPFGGRIDGIAPTYSQVVGKPIDLTRAVTVDVQAVDPRGTTRYLPGVRYLPDADPCDEGSLTSVSPELASTAGGQEITVRGSGFTENHRVRVGGVLLTDLQHLSPSTLRGTLPRLEAGFYLVELLCQTGRVVSRLDDALETADPAVISHVEPEELSAEGGTDLRIFGTGLREQTVFLIDGQELERPLVAPDGRSVTGVAPAWRHPRAGDGATAGIGRRVIPPPLPRSIAVDVSASDIRGESTLVDGVRYVPENRLPGPEQVRSSLAEGSVRVQWMNPVPYAQVLVLDSDDQVIATLPGDATSYEGAVDPRADSVGIALQGIARAGQLDSHLTEASAARAECEYPPPLNTFHDPDLTPEYADVEFSLYGDHPPAVLSRCSEDRASEGEGAVAQAFEAPNHGALPRGTGYINVNQLPFGPSSVTTGFVLDAPAQKLEFAAYYNQIAIDFGLELRGRLRHVFPDTGFEDEFTFPPVLIEEMGMQAQKRWNHVTYFRADSDVGRELGGVDDPGPQPCPTDAPCGLREIPAGEYVLTLYAVGGDENVPYFAVAADPRPDELLIPGTPCPPYPQVRVRDVSGFDTLPTITDIDAITHESAQEQARCTIGDTLSVNLSALGTWLDSCGQSHPLGTTNSRFEFRWIIFDRDIPCISEWSHATDWDVCLNCGCYEIEFLMRIADCPGSTRKFRHEIVVEPPVVPCSNEHQWSYTYPQPNPGNTTGIIALNTPPYNATGSCNRRPLEFQVLVSPNGAAPNCPTCADRSSCPAPTLETVEFDLAARTFVPAQGGGLRPIYWPLGADFLVDDTCPNQPEGAKYFHVSLEDLGEIPASSRLLSSAVRSVFLVGRQPNSGEPWQAIGAPMKLANAPDCLIDNPWNCTYLRPSEYRFEVRMNPDVEVSEDLGMSHDINIDFPGIDGLDGRNINIPGTEDNQSRYGFLSQFEFIDGMYGAKDALGGTRGKMMDTEYGGKPLEVAPSVSTVGGQGQIAGLELPEYQWCENGNIFNYELEQDVFSGLLYVGTIGPVPFSVAASIGFAFRMDINYQTTFYLRPFATVPGQGGGELAQAYFYVFADMGLEVPASIRADVGWGIASIIMKFIPGVQFTMTPWIALNDPSADAANLDLRAQFNLDMQLEACVLWDTICIESDRLRLFSTNLFNPLTDCPPTVFNCGEDYSRDCVNGGFDGDGTPAGLQRVVGVEERISKPVSLVSPDGQTYAEVWVRADEQDGRIVSVRYGPQTHDFLFPGQDPDTLPYFLDPAGEFISNDRAIIAVTRPDAAGLEELPQDTSDPGYFDTANRNAARANIWVHSLSQSQAPFFQNTGVPISETSADVNDWRAEGKPTVAGMPDQGDAFLAWVRYRTEFFADLGMRQTVRPCRPGDTCIPGHEQYTVETVRNLVPRLDQTAIYVRRLTYNTGTDTIDPVTLPLELSTGGINIEPSIDALPNGDVGACVWVHDGVHSNLIDSNRDRQLLCSVYDGVSDTWSAPVDVVRPAILDDYPALLEPQIRLRRDDQGDLRGIVAFTAVPPGAPEDDTGLGGLRYLYLCRVTQSGDGSFEFSDPEWVRGRCDETIYVWEYEIVFTFPPAIDPMEKINKHLHGWVVQYVERGLPGSEAATGLIHAISVGDEVGEMGPPVEVAGQGETVMNLTATAGQAGMHSMYLNEGAFQDGAPQAIVGGQGAAAGVDRGEPGFKVVDMRLDADLVLASCRLSDQMPGPGARVTATLRVENLGLAGTAFDDGGDSLVGVEIVYRENDGTERVVGHQSLPILMPGEAHTLEFEIEMPHDPVRLEARVHPNPGDANRSNDVSSCYFGAPAPRDIRCHAECLRDEEETLAAVVDWTNPVEYESILVYRDGRLLAEIAGARERFVDIGVEGEHTYDVRGCIGVSDSKLVGCEVEVLCSEPLVEFRRGDFNNSGGVDLSDAVSLLAFLFTGRAPSPCPDSGDTDDSGDMDISDAVAILGYLFLGRTPPAPPGPIECGPDPTEDALGPCDSTCS